MNKKRGQISFEYLVIIGFGMLILITALYLFYNYSVNSNDSFIVSKINDFGNKFTENAEILHYTTGTDSYIIIEVILPENVKEIYFINRSGESELVVGYNLKRGYTENVYFLPIKVRGYTIYPDPNKTSPLKNINSIPTGALKLKLINIVEGIQVEEAT